MRSSWLQYVMAAGLAGVISGGLAGPGCSTAPRSDRARDVLGDEVNSALNLAEGQDPSLRGFLDRSYAYAVFPTVGKGGAGIGGAYGRGEVFEQGQMVGYCDLTQATIGLQLGGQKYTEIIAFQDKAALDRFKNNQMSFAAEASAVALKAGAGANARYTNGVSVMTVNEKGLMAEASVGGQKFTFVPR